MSSVGLVERVWDLLGQPITQLFGKECASAAILMFLSLGIRFVVVTIGMGNIVPAGFIFAFPYFTQTLANIFPFMDENSPLLIVRIAESLVGR